MLESISTFKWSLKSTKQWLRMTVFVKAPSKFRLNSFKNNHYSSTYNLTSPRRNISCYLCWSLWGLERGCIPAGSPAGVCNRPSSPVQGWWVPHTAWLRRVWRTRISGGSRWARRALTAHCNAGSSPLLTAEHIDKCSKNIPNWAALKTDLLQALTWPRLM